MKEDKFSEAEYVLKDYLEETARMDNLETDKIVNTLLDGKSIAEITELNAIRVDNKILVVSDIKVSKDNLLIVDTCVE